MDVFLLILVIVIAGAAVVSNVRLLVYFQQPEDAKLGYSVVCKAIIVISLTLAWLINMLLPVDVRSSRPVPSGINMGLVWEIAFITLGVFLLVIVPAATFYTEVEGDDVIKRKRRYVVCNMLLTLFFSIAAIGISYPFLSDAAIPVVQYDCDLWQDAGAAVEPAQLASALCASKRASALDIKVGFQVYLIAVLCFIGWFFFVVFGGIGLSAVPLDLILAYTDRPRAIDEQTYQQRRRLLGQVAAALIGRGEELQGKDSDMSAQSGWRASRKKRAMRTEYNRFKRDVLLVETEFERLKISKFMRGESIAVSIAKLVLGILCAILSILWVLQIIVCILIPQANPALKPELLDGILAACENSGLYPLGIALFSLFSMYLLVCVVKGCMKFGMRLFFLFSIHPMRHQGTPLNSILFNVELVLVTSAAVVQFTQVAFANYARLTDAEVIFSAQVKYMTFYSWFFEYNVFIYMLLGWFLLSLIYLLIRPRDTGELRFDKNADKKLAKIVGGGKAGKHSDKQPLRSASAELPGAGALAQA